MWEMLENICLSLAQRASASVVYFKQFKIRRWLFFGSISKLYNSKTQANIDKPNGSGRFLSPICHLQEAKGCKLDNGTACLCISVLTIVCSLSGSLNSTWRKPPLSCGWENYCPEEMKFNQQKKSAGARYSKRPHVKITNRTQRFIYHTANAESIFQRHEAKQRDSCIVYVA